MLHRTDYERIMNKKKYENSISLTNDYLQMIIFNVRRINTEINISLLTVNE